MEEEEEEEEEVTIEEMLAQARQGFSARGRRHYHTEDDGKKKDIKGNGQSGGKETGRGQERRANVPSSSNTTNGAGAGAGAGAGGGAGGERSSRKRANKNRPREESSRRHAKHRHQQREVVTMSTHEGDEQAPLGQTKKSSVRDPRFDAGGDGAAAAARYAFLYEEVIPQEVKETRDAALRVEKKEKKRGKGANFPRPPPSTPFVYGLMQ